MVDSPPTIYDVAARAGVSTATVSRALNSLSSVRPSTREKVFAAMEELEFVPNVVARGLSSGKHWILGLVFTRAVVDNDNHQPDDSVLVVEEASLLYTDIVIRGAEMRAAEHGYSLLLSSADERHPSGMTSLLNLTGTVDGLILLDRVLKDDDVAYLARRIPVVLLAGRGNVDSVVTVRVDNEQAMRILVEHLYRVHGVMRFGFVTGADESPDSVARASAFRRFISELGGTLDEVDFLKADWTSSGGELAMQQRLENPTPLPGAFVCANDQTAVGVIFALKAGGLRVPDDVAVTGFDDISLTRYFNPSLTTIRQSGSILGEVAVDALLAMMGDAHDVQRTIVLPTELIVRESCGCLEDPESRASVSGTRATQREVV
ncbi:MAG: LacI family DNA-binding transcriptional regulator [Acidimicrobiales bacterium]